MGSLEPRLIEAFQAVVDTGSATLAAERLRMTQPAVTRSIATLESKTGLDLFERGRFGMRLTSVGELFAEEVERSFAGLGRIGAAAESLRQGLRGRIVIGAFPIYAEGVIAEVIGEMLRETPDLSIRIDTLRDKEIIRGVLHDEIQIGVIPGKVSAHARLHSRKLADRRTLAVMRAGHPLANRAEISIPELGEVEVIHYSPLNIFRSIIDEAFARMTTPVKHRIEVLTQRTALKLAVRSDAVALCDRDAISEIVDQHPDLRIIPVIDGPAWEVSMIWSRERTPSPLVAATLERIARGFADQPEF